MVGSHCRASVGQFQLKNVRSPNLFFAMCSPLPAFFNRVGWVSLDFRAELPGDSGFLFGTEHRRRSSLSHRFLLPREPLAPRFLHA